MKKLLLAILLIILPGCCALTHSCPKPAQDVIDCGTDAIKQEMANLYPTVLAILTGTAPDWHAQLQALEAVGKDALACALDAVEQDLLKVPMPASAPTATPEAMTSYTNAQRGIDRAKKFESDEHFVYDTAKP